MEPVLRPFRPEDAAAVAAMWNESKEAWPGGFGGGEDTAEHVRSREAEADYVSLNLIELGDRIVGYCRVMASNESKDYAYLELLNVSPDCHGKSFGRILVHRAVQDAVDAKLRMFDIHTWPSNMKAMPLYKKTGFYWVPDTSVYMQNYVPQLVHLPATKAFFEKHDWYTSIVRTLDQEPDELKWHGKKVFAYHFEADGSIVKARIDREARSITELETDDFRVAAWIEGEEVPAGVPRTVTWELENKTGKPVPASLLAEGEDADVRCHMQENVLLEGSATFTGECVVSPDFTRKEGPIEALILRSDIFIDGVPVRLRTSLNAKNAVELALDLERTSLVPAYRFRGRSA